MVTKCNDLGDEWEYISGEALDFRIRMCKERLFFLKFMDFGN